MTMDTKSVFLKTYGKQQQQLFACMSPETHKRAFDTTNSDVSVFEAQKPTNTRKKRTSVASHRAARPARKKKATVQLMDCSDDNSCRGPNVENIIYSPSLYSPPAQQSKTKRRKKTVCVDRAVRPAKRKHLPRTRNSDEESVCKSSLTHHQQAQQNKTASVPAVDCFVTHRRCGAAATNHQLRKKRVGVLNSSNDFSSGTFSPNNNRRPFRRSRVPSTFILSSAESSMNVAVTSCVATKPLQEISLNESDPSFVPCSRKPIFCSTPSASSLRKHPRLKPFPINDVSLTVFQNNVDSSGSIASQHSVPPSVVCSHEKQCLDHSDKETSLHHHKEPSGDLFMEFKNASEDNKNHSKDPQTKSGEELPCLNLLCTNSEISSNFTTTEGALEWLVKTLKEKCLTEHCTVALERLSIPALNQMCSQTIYLSCVENDYFVESLQTIDHPVSVDSQTADLQWSSVESINSCLSATDHKNGNNSLPVNSFDDHQSFNISPLVDCKQSDKCSSTREFIEPSCSVIHDESFHLINGSSEVTMSRQESTCNTLQTEDVEAIKSKCLLKKCVVQVKNMTLSPLNFELEFAQQNESGLPCNDESTDLNAKTENDHTHNITSRDQVYTSAMQSHDPETKKEDLKVQCLTETLTVDVKRATLSEPKDVHNSKDSKPKSTTAVLDPASDNQSDCNQDSLTMKANIKKKSLTRSSDKKSSNTEGILPQRRKIPQASKERRSTSRDRPGTTRKACVSGLSVNRWKNKSNTSSHVFRGQTARSGLVKALDCSIDELISTQHEKQKVHRPTMNILTPVRTGPLNLSSVLADLTPNSNSWSRLKAALSVHRKGIVLLTPRSVTAFGSPGRSTQADVSKALFATPLRTPLPKHLRAQLYRDDSSVVCEDLSDAEKVYAECGQPRPLPWEECILTDRMKRCVKIGEGTFGEVFSTINASGDTVALKIIPIEGSERVNGEDQKTFGEILHEIIISKELSSLKEKQHNQTHSFIGLYDLHCVQGCYPPEFLNAWDRFHQQKGSENDRPDFFQRNQIFLILEFEFGGVDLENSNGTLASLGVAKSILHQVTAALAVAEQELHFEHRDLHWGNILVKTTKQKRGSFLLNGKTHSLDTKGVLVRIIDYSLSRLEIDELTVSCDISKDEELFMGQGDYQFEIYRLMRKENGNNWSDYHPHTNVLWLHYLCSKLLSMKYRCAGGRGIKEIRDLLTRFYDGVLQYSSATQVLQQCPMFQ